MFYKHIMDVCLLPRSLSDNVTSANTAFIHKNPSIRPLHETDSYIMSRRRDEKAM